MQIFCIKEQIKIWRLKYAANLKKNHRKSSSSQNEKNIISKDLTGKHQQLALAHLHYSGAVVLNSKLE